MVAGYFNPSPITLIPNPNTNPDSNPNPNPFIYRGLLILMYNTDLLSNQNVILS